MITYKISRSPEKLHTLCISMEFNCNENDELSIFLPTWRPGRYELTNYSENLENLQISKNANIIKLEKNKWKAQILTSGKTTISYEYYAHKMDAGNSWVDENQIYINFINLLLYIQDHENEEHKVVLELSPEYKLEGSLPNQSNTLTARSYYELIDSPLFASPSLTKHTYSIDNSTFDLVIYGEYFPNDAVIKDFVNFTKIQMELFDGFPAGNFKFLVQALPYRHYHGVEHKNSTVITIGPSTQLKNRNLYKEFLGVSSHELFHCWNVTRIKPKEFIPYDFSKECYYDTGYITEGLTTYYGDLMLVRSKVFSAAEYFQEVGNSIQRHLQNPGRHKQSLLESSIDLWVDGYKNQAPFRGVSIYTKGMLCALILDLKIIIKSNGKLSLDNVMRDLWQQFGDGNRGYSSIDYLNILEKYLEPDETKKYFNSFISGKTPIEDELFNLLKRIGIKVVKHVADNELERNFGFKTIQQSNQLVIKKIDPNSPINSSLHIDDVIKHCVLKKGDNSITCSLILIRNGEVTKMDLHSNNQTYFDSYQLVEGQNLGDEQEKLKKYWLFRE